MTGLLPYPNSLVGNGIGAIFPSWTTPMNQMWNANIQRSVTKNLIVEAAYIGSRGEHIWNNFNRNATFPQYLSMGTQLNNLVPNPFFGKITTGAMSAATVRLGSLLVPYPQYSGVSQIRASVGDSIYHGFTLRAERPFSHGLLFQASYTGAKLIDNVNERFLGGTNYINPYDLSLSRSISAADISQRFVANYVYELPFGHGKQFLSHGIGSWILGNWQTSGISHVPDRHADLHHGGLHFPGRERTWLLCGPLEKSQSAERQPEHESVVRHHRVRQSRGILLRQRFAHRAESAQPRRHQLRFRDEPLAAHPRAHAAAVPRRVVQPAEPPEPGCAERRHHLFDLRPDHLEERQPHGYDGTAAGILELQAKP